MGSVRRSARLLGGRILAAWIGFAAGGLAPPPLGADAAGPDVVDDASIERALAGVVAFISANAGSIATGITASCPLMRRDELGWFMGQQELAPSLDGWSVALFMYDGVGNGAPGVACGVDIAAHVAASAGAPHGARLEAIAVPAEATLDDLLIVVEGGRVVGPGDGEIGGEIGGTCYPGPVATCVLMWYRSGLAITTVIAGPAASVTERRTITLMTSMIPTMVERLARYADEVSPPTTTAAPAAGAPTTAPAPVLDTSAARTALAEFIAAHPVGTSGPETPGGMACPSSPPAAIGDAMSEVGLVPALDPFHVTIRGSAIAPGLVTVSCGGDVIDALVQATAGVVPGYTPSLTVYDITGVATVDHVLAERPGLVRLPVDVPATGGDLYGGPCDVASGSGTFCVRVWHRDGLVVMFEVSGNARPGFDDAATQVITALVPTVVSNLATRAAWPALRPSSIDGRPGTVRRVRCST